jgi:hypothetical protein
MKLTEMQHKFIDLVAAHQNYYAELNPIWRTCITCLRYVLYLPEWELARLRMHTGIFTGQLPSQYWHLTGNLTLTGESIARNTGYEYLVAGLPDAYCIYEPDNPEIPGRMGVPYRGRAINFDVAHFQNVITNLWLTGELQRLHEKARSNRVTCVEIGSGYGGLAYHLCGLLARRISYVLVDLPEILFFAAAYLTTHLKDIRVIVVETDDQLRAALKNEYDIILIPSFFAEALRGVDTIDLAINIDSFQEMNRADVDSYCRLICPRLRGVFYSDNIDKHDSLNTDATETLSAIFSRHGTLYPNPTTYESFTGNRGWKWFYSIYVLGSPERISQCTKRLKGMAGNSRGGQPFEVTGQRIAFADPFWRVKLCLRGVRHLLRRLSA